MPKWACIQVTVMSVVIFGAASCSTRGAPDPQDTPAQSLGRAARNGDLDMVKALILTFRSWTM
jgi:hypothetical protein